MTARRGWVAAMGLAVCAAWPQSAGAYRPFDSTDAAVAPKGNLEVELEPLGLLIEGADRALIAPGATLNWGIADGSEVVLEGRDSIHVGSADQGQRLRIEDTALSLKSVLRDGDLQGRHGVSLATELSILLPTLRGEPGTGGEAALIASRRWDGLTVHLNGAAAWTRAHTAGAFGGMVVEVHDTWKVRPVGEIVVEGARQVPTMVSALAGAIWRVSDELSLDAAIRRARSGAVNTTEFRVGLTWSFSIGVPAPGRSS